MSSEGNITFDFAEIPAIKDALKIKQTDEKDDILLKNTIAPAADKFVKGAIFGKADSFPLDSDIQEIAVSAATNKAASLYKAYNNNMDMAKFYKELANEDIQNLQKRLKDSHTARTRIVVSSPDYDTEDPLFSQRIL